VVSVRAAVPGLCEAASGVGASCAAQSHVAGFGEASAPDLKLFSAFESWV